MKLKSEQDERQGMQEMLAGWEERYKELKNEKHKLMKQYENLENQEIEDIRELRKEAA